MRWDSNTGQYDMGFRNYDPGLNQFLSRDMYNGALADMNLTADPFTGAPTLSATATPISNIELDGHMFPAGGGAAGCPSKTPGYHPAAPSSGGGGCGWSNLLGCLKAAGHGLGVAGNWLGQQATNLGGGISNGVTDTVNFIGWPFRWLGTKLFNSFPTGAIGSGQLIFTNHASDKAPLSPWKIGNPNSIVYKAGYFGWPLLFPPAEGDEAAVSIISRVAQAQADRGGDLPPEIPVASRTSSVRTCAEPWLQVPRPSGAPGD